MLPKIYDLQHPIDPLLLEAELAGGEIAEPVKVRYLGRFIASSVGLLGLCMFLMVSFGTSMSPTLGDFSVSLKIPDMMIGEVSRGDVVAIRVDGRRYPWINKRVIGLPGEVVSIAGGVVRINGEQLPETYLPDGKRGFDFDSI